MWEITINDAQGFNYFGVIDIVNILDMGDFYNIMVEDGADIYLHKKDCVIRSNIIIYRGNISLVIEYMGDT